MKKLLRKNQIIITALVVMVALAGYLSLTGEEELALNLTGDGTTAQTESGQESAENTEENVAAENVDDSEVADISEEDTAAQTAEQVDSENVASKENAGEAVLVNNTVKADYFESAKLSRELTRAKNKETLLELVNSKTASDAQKEKAMNEIVAMTAVNEKETATENLLAAKGFDETVVTIVNDSVDVIVNAEELTEQQIAQIEDVVKRKAECTSDKIVISPVGKKQ